jgi:hypothetical protein
MAENTGVARTGTEGTRISHGLAIMRLSDDGCYGDAYGEFGHSPMDIDAAVGCESGSYSQMAIDSRRSGWPKVGRGRV